MSKLPLMILLGTIFGSPLALATELPKEGDFAVTSFSVGQPRKTLPVANGGNALMFEDSIVYTNDAGQGLLDDMTGRCFVLGNYEGNRPGQGTPADFHFSGYCTTVDRDGDIIFSTFNFSRKENAPIVGTRAYTGGTGKYTGLTGTSEYKATFLKTVDKDTPPIVKSREHGHYQILTTGGPPTTRP
jgi:hypothetical protein